MGGWHDLRPPPLSRWPEAGATGARPKGYYELRALVAREREPVDAETLADLATRPKTWGECRGRSGPCAFVGCEAHIYLDVNPVTGAIKLNFPDTDPLDIEEPCVLRHAERGSMILDEVGERMGLTRERIRQIEKRALAKLAVAGVHLR